jgi:hypothetical protein
MSEYKEYTVRVYEDRTEWRVDRNLHRENGPAITWDDGSEDWCVDGKRHRIGGPAIIRATGSKYWCFKGEYHRTNGPAIEHANGIKEWWIDGEQISEDEFNERNNPPAAPCHRKVVEIDGKRYRLVAE